MKGPLAKLVSIDASDAARRPPRDAVQRAARASSRCTSRRSFSTGCAGKSLLKPMITGKRRASSPAWSRCGRAKAGSRSSAWSSRSASPAGSSPEHRRSGVDRGASRGPHRGHADPHRTDAQPRDPQVPSRPDRDGGGTRDFPDADSAEASPLASALFASGMVEGVFFGRDFISVTAAPGVSWGDLEPLVLETLLDHFVSGAPLFAPGHARPASRSTTRRRSRKTRPTPTSSTRSRN